MTATQQRRDVGSDSARTVDDACAGAAAASAPPTAPTSTATTPSTATRTEAPTPTSTKTTADPAPAPPPPPAPAPPPSDGASPEELAAEAEVLRLVNVERAKAGCPALAADGPLTTLARSFSADMAARGFFSHTDPDGMSPWDRAAAAGIGNLRAENIALGQATPDAVMRSWMGSDGHRTNILNCDYRTLGVGVHIASGGPWWTQEFGV